MSNGTSTSGDERVYALRTLLRRSARHIAAVLNRWVAVPSSADSVHRRARRVASAERQSWRSGVVRTVFVTGASLAMIASAQAADTIPPSVPTIVSATGGPTAQIVLTWTASTDNVGVTAYVVEDCFGLGCSNFTHLSTIGGSATSAAIGVGAYSTTFTLRMRAQDAAGNLSGYSNVVSASTPAQDTSPPSVPTGLAAKAVASTQVNLSWNASTDNVAVGSYNPERCQGSGCTNFVALQSIGLTTYSDTGVVASTVYRYRIRAEDTSLNLSGYSSTVTVTTPQLDTQAPTAPTNFAVTATSVTQVSLSWTASTDNLAVAGYQIERCVGASCTAFTLVAQSTTTSVVDSNGVLPATSYRYRARAFDYTGNLSAYSAILSTATPADTQPPTVPTFASATAVSSTQIDVGWVGSTDNLAVSNYRVERCTGSACANFVQIAAPPTAVIYSDKGLTPATSYRYRIRAADAAGNLSGYSSIGGATTPADTQAPTAPTNLVATATSSTQINLTWTASTDNVAVTGYRIERCSGASCSSFTQIATATAAAYSDAGLAVTTTYRYRVRANDAVGNLSGYSGTATATTQSVPDTTPPTVPANLSAAVNNNSANLSWVASTDNVGVTGYKVERCTGLNCSAFVQVGAPTGTSYLDSGLTASTNYNYRVRATDAAGNLSAYTAALGIKTSPADSQPPTAPTGLTATSVSSTQINLSWTASTDNVGVTGYRLERCSGASCSAFAQIATPSGTSYSDSGLTASTSYSYRVRANDAVGNLSGYSNTASATTQAGDTQAPTTPGNLAATAASSSQINLTWSASTDNVGVTGYRVERCTGASCSAFAQIATPTATSYADSGLTVSTSYSYRVRATDAAGNLSSYSGTASATTPAAGDTQAPSTPGNVAAMAASSSQINLTWSASTDNVGVTGYRVERCTGPSCSTFAQIATPTATSYADTGLSGSTTYGYRVRATDAAGNLSSYSGTASATTPAAQTDTQPPTAPSALAATVISATQVNLSWTASTDNVGVTAYLVERCAGYNCSTFAQIGTATSTAYNDIGAQAYEAYSYRVRATDAAANLSGYSGVASATTGSGSSTYTYDANGHLTTISGPGTTTVHYTYDAAGNVISIQVIP